MNYKNNAVNTKEGKLILDSHKLPYHFDRVKAWEDGERIAPVCVDMALTRACGAMCSFCYAMVQEPQERANIKTKEALNLLDDFAEIGVRGVSLISDGESTISKAYVPFIQHAAKIGIDVGNATNGWEWEPSKIDQVLPYLTWVRFTVAAGTPEGYAKIMFKSSEHTNVFDRAMSHIKYAVDLKKKLNLKVTLGIQMVLMPEFKDEIIPFAKLAVDLGVDYGVIKHCSDDEFGTLGVDYSKYEGMYKLLDEAEKMSNDKTKVIVKWDKLYNVGICNDKNNKHNFELPIQKSNCIPISIVYKHPEMTEDINLLFLPNEMYCVNNCLFSKAFVRRCLDYQENPFVFDDRYTINIMDSNVTMYTMTENHYMKILVDKFWIIKKV